jgi:hypothetical protein
MKPLDIRLIGDGVPRTPVSSEHPRNSPRRKGQKPKTEADPAKPTPRSPRASRSSTGVGESSSRPRSERSESERASSAGWRTGGFSGIGANFLNERAELFEDVVDGLDQSGTVADQVMAAPARHAVRRTGDGEDFAVLFHGV